jgi:hypothetical protein
MDAMRANSMEPTYFSAYRSLKLTRDAEGVLIGEFHSGGEPLIFRAQDHTELWRPSIGSLKTAKTRS